jgi:A/G-specific adenine glycosylase
MNAARQRSSTPDKTAAALLAWYDVHRRVLPWRARAGERADPYRVWLSEIMLQQTTVEAVGRYYREFLSRWPTVETLAKAPLDDVLAAWAGLGYYARARNLHRAAKTVVEEFDGEFPASHEQLKRLPGVGAYTAGAIAAIAFDLPYAAMDANAERVLARLFAIQEPLPKAKPRLRELGQQLVPLRRAGDFAQALMDLGAAICTPKKPVCNSCPLNAGCEAFERGIQEALPVKAEKPARPLRRGAAFVAQDANGAVLLMKRPEQGLLGGMLQPPLGPWTDEFPTTEEALLQAPFPADWKRRAGIVRHGFTHFELEVEVYVAKLSSNPPLEGGSEFAKQISGRGFAEEEIPPPNSSGAQPRKNSASPSRGEAESWVPQSALAAAALPTVMRKIVAHALDDSGPLFRRARRQP